MIGVKRFRILNLYGLGFFCTNFIIGSILSFLAGEFGKVVGLIYLSPFIWDGLASVFLVIGGTIMLFQIFRRTYWPHTDQYQELGESLPTLKQKKRTGFLLGLLAAMPPCIFQLTEYSQAIVFSMQSSWGNGVWTVFFGIGTWIGLYPLALIGTMSGRSLKHFNKVLQIEH